MIVKQYAASTMSADSNMRMVLHQDQSEVSTLFSSTERDFVASSATMRSVADALLSLETGADDVCGESTTLENRDTDAFLQL